MMAGDLLWAVLCTEYLRLLTIHVEALIAIWRVEWHLEMRPLADNWV